ncbi:MAG: hypothetical protein KC431_15825 [Myxococcales bacterium]|nr:hypothetical protein [Myxococcales bacterium]
MSVHPHYQLCDAIAIEPVMHVLSESISQLFPLPEPSCVGTLDTGNSLVRITLDPEPGIEVLAADFAAVSAMGVERFPTRVGSELVYASRRLLYRFDGQAMVSYILASIRETIHAFDVLDPRDHRYFATLRPSSIVEQPLRLLLFDIVGEKLEFIADHSCTTSSRFATHSQGLLIADGRAITAFGRDLQPQGHPLERLLAELPWADTSSRIDALLLDPDRSSAYMIERTQQDSQLWLLDWSVPEQPRCACLVQAPLIYRLAMSPDNRWLMLRCREQDESIYVLPATPSEQQVPLRLLTAAEAGPVTSSVWTDGVVSVAGCAQNLIYHWPIPGEALV